MTPAVKTNNLIGFTLKPQTLNCIQLSWVWLSSRTVSKHNYLNYSKG